MRSPTICLIALAIAVLLLVQPALAQPLMQVPYIRAGPVWFLAPHQEAALFIQETNTNHLAASDTEAFAVSFVPGPGSFAFAPVIAQTSSRTIVADQSYFFRDFSSPAR